MAKEFEKALAHIAAQTKLYRETDIMDGQQMNNLLQQIVATLSYLETIRATYHEKWQEIVYKQVLAGQSVARAENQAHVLVPEMYLLRRVMDGSYEVVGAIRTNISWLKTQEHNSNSQQT